MSAVETLERESVPAPAAADRAAAPKTAVVALGSVVMGDDGAGAAALEQLAADFELPAGVDLLDLGTPGPYFAEYLRGAEAVVVLDTVRAERAPGEIVVYRGDAARRPPSPRSSPHSPDLGEALATLAVEGLEPRHVVVIGVVPQRVAAGTALSAAVRDALPAVAALAAAELAALGHAVVPRDRPRPALLWWEKPRPAPA